MQLLDREILANKTLAANHVGSPDASWRRMGVRESRLFVLFVCFAWAADCQLLEGGRAGAKSQVAPFPMSI